MTNWGKKNPISLLACVAAIALPCAAQAEDAKDAQGANGSSASQTSSAPAGSTAAPASTDSGAGAAAPAGSSSPAPAATPAPATTPAPTTTPAPAAPGEDKAREALKQKAEDASSQKNLEQVFKAAEKTYSLLKAGGVNLTYGVTYSYFRDSQIDIALSDNASTITRFRIEEDAQHSFTNDLSLDYGVWDNLTFNVDLPLIAKLDTNSGNKTAGLGDVSFSARWQPFPLKRGLPTTTLFGTFSTATGDSPYDINLNKDLSTGKGFYSLSGGASVSKVMDPVVLFASGSYTYGLPVSGLNQARGSTSHVLTKVTPGDSFGMSLGLAYSLNYDISVSGSLQVSTGLATKFNFSDGTQVNSAEQVTSTLNMGLSLRTSPKRIVNLNFGFGLTPDSPNLILGFNIPLDIEGFTTGQ